MYEGVAEIHLPDVTVRVTGIEVLPERGENHIFLSTTHVATICRETLLKPPLHVEIIS